MNINENFPVSNPMSAAIVDMKQLHPLMIACFRECLRDLIAQKTTRLIKKVPTILEAADMYINDRTVTGHLTEKTAAENTAIFRLLERVIGDKYVHEITMEDVASFRATLQRLPPNMNKNPVFRNMTIGQILEAKPEKRLTLRSVNKYLDRVSGLLNWCNKKGFIRANAFHGAQIKDRGRPDEKRCKLDLIDLEKLFAPAHFQIGAADSWRFYIMLIALVTGMRLEEICQLDCTDIINVDGIQCIDINEGGDKKLKTPGSRRLIPIHSTLINHFDFLGFVDRQSKVGTRLFPALKSINHSYGHAYSRWFATYRKQCGVTEAGKTFHSFRHTAATVWKDLDVFEYLAAEILGHTVSTITYGHYGKASPVLKMQSVIEKLNFEEVLRPVFLR